jgi:DNA-binding NarL/FixJ family response regulator
MKIISVTRHDEESFVQRMFAAGADGYVCKQVSSNNLTSAIRAVARGEHYVDPSVVRARTVEPLPQAKGVVSSPQAAVQLTAIEAQVLRLTAAAYSNAEIAERVALGVAAVSDAKSRAMAKLGLRSRVHVIEYAREQGWYE